MGVLFMACGLFSLLGAGLDWEWFMNHRKARFLTAILTRTGARYFYGLLGLALVVLGVLMAAGLLKDGE